MVNPKISCPYSGVLRSAEPMIIRIFWLLRLGLARFVSGQAWVRNLLPFWHIITASRAGIEPDVALPDKD